MKHILSILLFFSAMFYTYAYDTPAFPGAEGYGRYATGGRGGMVLHVTNLNDSGEGSLRWAIEQEKPRIIVFDVSGIIELKSSLKISHGNVTIAGQTAPGDGICLKNYELVTSADNVVIRFIRCRPGDEHNAEGDAATGRYGNNVIIDHCSMSWSTDETASFYNNSKFTMQWCLISEGLMDGGHCYAGIWGGQGATFHHNLVTHHTSRTPRLCGSRYTGLPGEERTDLRNNVFYNWGPTNGGYAGEGGSYNFVNNYYKPGPSTAKNMYIVHRIFSPSADNGQNTNVKGTWGKFYVSGNYFDDSCAGIQSNNSYVKNIASVNADNWNGIHPVGEAPDSMKSLTEFDVVTITEHSAARAYKQVLAYVGASHARDTIDRRIVAETLGGYYTHEGSNGSSNGIIDSQNDVGGYPTYNSTARLRDRDNDGIPDAWELANGLDPDNVLDAASPFPNGGGYTAVEVYINSLVEDIMKAGNADADTTIEEMYPEYVQPIYTDADYYAPGESYELSLVGGTPATITWRMTSDYAQADTTPAVIDTELSFSRLSHQLNKGYLRYASDYWVDSGGINTNVHLQYKLTPQQDYYLAIDSITFDAMRMSTNGLYFSARYASNEDMCPMNYIYNGEQPARDTFQHFSYVPTKPVIASVENPFVLQLLPYFKTRAGSMKYAVSYKDVRFYGRIGTIDNIRTSTGGESENDSFKLPAFPGAEGYGRYTTGGRGGRIIHVTNLNDSGEGSLRWAINQPGARIIVFDVSGTIELQSHLTIRNGDVTIAGQTAPGDGICLKNYALYSSADNVIIRFIRSRLGDECAQEDDAMTGIEHSNIIIDHCTMSWATDETASFYDNSNFTMQWCLITESLNNSVHVKGKHGYGGLWGGKGASFHHNLLAHHINRHPLLCGSRYSCRPDLERVDLRNNVVYHWCTSNNALCGAGGVYNFVNNYYKPGPSTMVKSALAYRICAPDNGIADTTIAQKESTWGKFYLDGNIFDATCPDVRKNGMVVYNMGEVNRDNWLGMYITDTLVAQTDSLKADVEFEAAPVTLHYARTAYRKVLDHVGASLARDTIDRRVLAEVEGGYYTYEGSKGSSKGIIDSQSDVGGWCELHSAPRLRDSDNDGIPNAWEIANGLDPRNYTDASQEFPNAGGYTAIEVYINSLVEDIMKAGNADADSTITELYPTYIQPTYTDADYYAPGENYENESGTEMIDGTPGSIRWTMATASATPYSAPENIDAEMSIAGLAYIIQYDYLTFGSEYWCKSKGYNDTLYLQYDVRPQADTYFAIDSVTLYAKRLGTDYMYFSASYDTIAGMPINYCLASEIKPERNTFEYFSLPLKRPLVIAPGQTFTLRLQPYSGAIFSSMKYSISFKDVKIYGRRGTIDNIETSAIVETGSTLSDVRVSYDTQGHEARLSFSLSAPSNMCIDLINVAGIPLHHSATRYDAGSHALTIPTHDLAPGIYLCHISTDTGTYTQKIIVTK